ncbi:MAG: hypothetical protein OXG59_08345 [Gammaproteobacteria bacterium]|nr:hypothetical protein [Gammaproteobacteria bacterium]
MPLQTYQPKYVQGRCVVLLTPTGFRFSVAARDMAQLAQINWMRLHTDSEERLIVFEPVPGLEKKPDLLKLGTSKKGHKSLAAKGLIARMPWIRSVATQTSLEARKFDLGRYHGALPPQPDGDRGNQPWYIQLRPAFENWVFPSNIQTLNSDTRGIYRYLKADEIIYIGKGRILERYQEPGRNTWGVSKIEYSEITDDDKALEWEAWWIDRFQQEHNGNLPRYNQVRGQQH